MFRRLATSRWVRFGLLAVALGFCAYGLAIQRQDVTAALRSLSVGSVIGSIAAAIAGMACMMLSWRTLLRDLGSPLPVRTAIRVLFIAQLGKYVPGAVWATAAQVELGHGHQIPRKNSAAAATVSMLVSLATGLLVAAVALPLSSGHAVRTYWWAFALVPLTLVILYPPLTGFFLNLALRLLRRSPLERRISGAGLSRAVGWSLAGWALYSIHLWLLVADVTGKAAGVLLISAGAYALAWSVGFILIPFPGGVGPREAALTVVLAPVMTPGSAFVIAVVSRLVMTIADLAWAGVAFLLGRGALRDRGQPAPGGQAPGSAQPPPGSGPGASLPVPSQRTSG